MINHNLKFVFIQIPKTGTTSISEALLSTNPEQMDSLDKNADNWKHMSATQAKKILKQQGKEPSDYFFFSFVRNPYTRLFSLYNFINNTIRDYEKYVKYVDPGKPKRQGWEEWLELCYEIIKSNPTFKSYIQNHKGEVEMDDYRHFLFDDGANAMDFIGRFENLQNDFDKVCDKIGIKRSRLDYLNSSVYRHGLRKHHYHSAYDNETIEIVAKKFKENLKLFNYKFDQ